MNNELQAVFEYMEKERGLDRATLIDAVETALQSAARKGVVPAKDTGCMVLSCFEGEPDPGPWLILFLSSIELSFAYFYYS